MDLIESAQFNLGRNKNLSRCARKFSCIACKVSFQRGFEGFLTFTAKTKLIEHYEKTLVANHFGHH